MGMRSNVVFVGNENDRLAGRVQVVKHPHNFIAGLAIKITGWLIRQDQCRIIDQGSCGYLPPLWDLPLREQETGLVVRRVDELAPHLVPGLECPHEGLWREASRSVVRGLGVDSAGAGNSTSLTKSGWTAIPVTFRSQPAPTTAWGFTWHAANCGSPWKSC